MKRIPLIIALFFMLGHNWPVVAGTIGVTAVEEEQEGKVAIVFNQKVKISGVKVLKNKENGAVKIVYPSYRAKNGHLIPQVEIRSKELEREIAAALLGSKIEKEKSVDIDYKIDKITLYKRKDARVKAFAEIGFAGILIVHARIMQSSDGVWVAWPGYKDTSGQWQKQVLFLDYTLKDEIEKKIIEKYETIVSEEPL